MHSKTELIAPIMEYFTKTKGSEYAASQFDKYFDMEDKKLRVISNILKAKIKNLE
jgi:hypothetical protein